MKFGGIHKASLIDYPGKIGCTVFTIGCNFSCPYCHNAELISGNQATVISENDILSFLQQRLKLIDAVIVTGGEPTLHNRLANFLRQIKLMGFAVKLDTNGSHPAVLQNLFEKELVDYIALDLKTLPAEYDKDLGAPRHTSDNLMKSIDLIMNSGISCEFRTTCVKPFVSPAMVKTLGNTIAGAPLWIFQHCKPAHVLDPSFFESRDRLFSEEELTDLKAIAAHYVKRCFIR